MTTEFEIYVKTERASFTQALDRWNADVKLDLTAHGKNEYCSVWSIDNSLLTAEKLDTKTTEIRLRPRGLLPPSVEANIAWNKIGELCIKVEWISRFKPVRLGHLDEMRNRFTNLQQRAETPLPKGVKGARRKRLARVQKDAATKLEAHQREYKLSIDDRARALLEGTQSISRKRRSEGGARDRLGGPTARTQERFEEFRRLKEKNPTWSQSRVAIEAFKGLGEQVTADTVRNTYRAMGVKWERGDRIR